MQIMALNTEVSGDLEVETVSDDVFLNNWAAKNKISGDVVEKLKQEGFTSMDALVLIDRDDLSKSKLAIPRGLSPVPVPAKKDRQNSLSQKRSFLSLFVFIIV